MARTNLGLEIGVNVQAYDADLASWAGVTRAAGFDAFVATPSSANLRTLITDESGSGALLFAGGALGTPASGVLTNCTGLTTSGIAAATLVTSGEGIGSNNNDTTIPTSAAVKAYADAAGRALLSDQLVSGAAVANLNFTQFNNATYRFYEFLFEDVLPTTDAVTFQMLFSTNGGSSYDNGANNYGHAGLGTSGSTAFAESLQLNTVINMTVASDVGNAAGELGVTGRATLYHAGNAATRTRVRAELSYETAAGNMQVWSVTGRRLTAQDTDAVRFQFSAGNIAIGSRIRMYGFN